MGDAVNISYIQCALCQYFCVKSIAIKDAGFACYNWGNNNYRIV